MIIDANGSWLTEPFEIAANHDGWQYLLDWVVVYFDFVLRVVGWSRLFARPLTGVDTQGNPLETARARLGLVKSAGGRMTSHVPCRRN